MEKLTHLELGFFHRLHLLRGFVEGAVAGIVAQVRRFGTEGARIEPDLMAQLLQAVEVHGKLELGQKPLNCLPKLIQPMCSNDDRCGEVGIVLFLSFKIKKNMNYG